MHVSGIKVSAKTSAKLTACVFTCLSAAACADPKSGQGFTLPEGDVDSGKAVFAALDCSSCHSVSGHEDLRPEGTQPEMTVALGGQTPRVATYGELVTSIINPSHRLAQGYSREAVSIDGVSRMRNYNDVMTVDELINLVTFLQAQYELTDYDRTYYYPYY